MTLDKQACRAMLEEYFTDYGPDQRFIMDLGPRDFFIKAQSGKERIPHEHQKDITDLNCSYRGGMYVEI